MVNFGSRPKELAKGNFQIRLEIPFFELMFDCGAPDLELCRFCETLAQMRAMPYYVIVLKAATK